MTLLLGLIAILAPIGSSVLTSLSKISFAAHEVRLPGRAEAGDIRPTLFLPFQRSGGHVVTVLRIYLSAAGILGGIALHRPWQVLCTPGQVNQLLAPRRT